MAVGVNSRRRIKEDVRYEVTAGAGERFEISNVLSAQRGAMVGQELCPEQLNSPVAADDSLFTNTSPPVLSNFERFTYSQFFLLFLSSNRQSKLSDTQFAEAYESECLESKNRISKELHHDSKVSRASYLCPLPIPSILSKTCGKSSPGNATNVQILAVLGLSQDIQLL
uniref:Uncharacterized protein n=1 Tax=Salix viminalis TaxID=40686 RepID=A0A6N2KFW5_SALVM